MQNGLINSTNNFDTDANNNNEISDSLYNELLNKVNANKDEINNKISKTTSKNQFKKNHSKKNKQNQNHKKSSKKHII
jgi:hypothetical protein